MNMNVYYSEAKDLFPGVLLDKSSGKFRIFGTSCPMEPFEFFDPILNWLESYSKDPPEETVLELNLNYFNTSSSKFLLKIFYILENMKKDGHEVQVDWYYSEEDDDMQEDAEEFENIVDLDFDLIPVKDDLAGEDINWDETVFEI